MKNNFARLILLFCDALTIYGSIVIAYGLLEFLGYNTVGELSVYTSNAMMYLFVLVILFGFRIYSYRLDFWGEVYLIWKALLLACIMLLVVFELENRMGEYSKCVIVISFIVLAGMLPMMKYLLKSKLALFGLWKKKAYLISGDSTIDQEICANPYLGYIKTSKQEAEVVFMNTSGSTREYIEERLSSLVHEKKEIIFIPILRSFNFSNASIIEVFDSRTNLVVLENSLLKFKNVFLKMVVDLFLSFLLIPLLIPIFALVIFLIKKEEPKGGIFFKQERLGKNGDIFVCYKFRTMYEESDALLQSYLAEHPEEVENYKVYHKYQHDPRITKIGHFLRKTSLDELPQIINVFRGEMSLIGPRPYMLNEKEKIGSKLDMVLAVKPGISGLWQVSGRSDVDFHSRVDMDVYYTRNWTLWFDVVIFFKTIRTILLREGAS